MTDKEYGKLNAGFGNMTRSEQRREIKRIFEDKDLNYRETILTLSFFVRKSKLSRFERSRLLSRFPRSLKVKCVAYCRENNIAVIRGRKPDCRFGRAYSLVPVRSDIFIARCNSGKIFVTFGERVSAIIRF